jgi:hypothetical protein
MVRHKPPSALTLHKRPIDDPTPPGELRNVPSYTPQHCGLVPSGVDQCAGRVMRLGGPVNKAPGPSRPPAGREDRRRSRSRRVASLESRVAELERWRSGAGHAPSGYCRSNGPPTWLVGPGRNDIVCRTIGQIGVLHRGPEYIDMSLLQQVVQTVEDTASNAADAGEQIVDAAAQAADTGAVPRTPLRRRRKTWRSRSSSTLRGCDYGLACQRVISGM